MWQSKIYHQSYAIDQMKVCAWRSGWLAEVTYELNTRYPTVAKTFTHLLACDLTHPGKKQPPICLSSVFMWHACLSQVCKYIGQACWFLVLYLFDRQDKNVILILNSFDL